MHLQKKNSVKHQIQHPWCVANFFEIVKGFGMFPNKVLHKVNMVEILQNARVGTAVHILPSMNLLRVSYQKYLINENVKAIDKESPVWYNKTRFSHF